MKNEPPYPRYKDPELQFTVSEVFDHLPANRQKIDLLLQLMKVTVVARAPGFIYFFLQSLHSMAVCRHASGRCCSLFSFLIFFFLSFHLSRFSFYINIPANRCANVYHTRKLELIQPWVTFFILLFIYL